MAEVEAGLTQATGCGYSLLEIDLLCLRARLHLATGKPTLAFQDAVRAKKASERPECSYACGLASATRLCADALNMQGQQEAARAERAEADRLTTELMTVHDESGYLV